MSRFADAMLAPLPNDAVKANDHDDLAGRGEEEARHDGIPLTFTEDDLRKGILRGVHVHEVVAGAGKHWAPNSLLSEEGQSWAFSVPVQQNTAFLSHSWSASRFLKWLALLFFFNGRSAVVTAILAGVFAVLVDMYMPINILRQSVKSATHPVIHTSLPFIIGTVLAVCALFAGHHFRRVLETARWLSRRTVFLDKLVIHQDDPELKMRGIYALGAFIRTSDVFLILWSKEYLTRLWCCYEVAVFAHLKRSTGFEGCLSVCPLPLVKIVVAKLSKGLLLGVTFSIISATSAYQSATWIGFALVLVPLLVGWTVATAMSTTGMLELFHEAGMMEHQIQTYDLRNAACFREEDRDFVETAVTAWFEPTSRITAIEKFNAFVRTELYASVGEALKGCGKIHWTVAMTACLPTVLFGSLGAVHSLPLVDWLFAFTQDVPLQMLSMDLQLRAVGSMERCGETRKTYASLPTDHTDGSQSSSERLSRRPFVMHLVVCTLLDFSLSFVYDSTSLVGMPMMVPVIATWALAICAYKC